MTTLQLTRNSPDGNAVRGTLTFPGGSTIPRSPSSPAPAAPAPASNGIPSLCSGIPTLENLSYLIPDGTYSLSVTYSPRFKRPLPLVNGVTGRTGIRFHRGSRPEHSLGCILLPTQDAVTHLTDFIRSHDHVLLSIL